MRRRFGAQALQWLALVAHRGVGAVVEDEEAARPGELEQPRAARRRQVGAGRVLAGRLDGDELDLVAGEDPVQRVDVRAVGVDRQRQDARAGRLQRGERAGERRRLDDRDVAGAEQRAGYEAAFIRLPRRRAVTTRS